VAGAQMDFLARRPLTNERYAGCRAGGRESGTGFVHGPRAYAGIVAMAPVATVLQRMLDEEG